MSAVAADRYRQFRVPQESGKALIDPPLGRVRGSLHALNADATFGGLEFCGKPISVVRSEARREVVLGERFGFDQAHARVPCWILLFTGDPIGARRQAACEESMDPTSVRIVG